MKPTSQLSYLRQVLANLPEGNENDCLEWPYRLTCNGYGAVYIKRPWKRECNALVHRLAYEIAVGPILVDQCVCHRCDNKKCFRPSHLSLGTKAENNHDRDAKGRGYYPGVSGEKNAKAKLSSADVLKMRELYRTGISCSQLGRQYQISTQSAWAVVKGKMWRSLD